MASPVLRMHRLGIPRYGVHGTVHYLHRDVYGDEMEEAGACGNDDASLFPWVPNANNLLLCSELCR
jgi:hypothetical protein